MTRSPAARSLPATRCPPNSRCAISSGYPASRCDERWPIWPSRVTSSVGKAWDLSSGNSIGQMRRRCPARIWTICGRRNSRPSVDVVEHDIRTPPWWIADALGRADGMLHILRVRRERRTRESLMITEAWLPADLSDALSASALKSTPLYELLSGAGVVVDRMQHEISAEIAGPRNADLLDVPIGSALLRVNRLAFVAGAPHHYVSILLSPSRSRVLMRESAEGLSSGDGLAIAHDVRRGSADQRSR